MNEIELSTNINQIELEIQWHKENAGRSVWEIGRRLNHVKENDLAHGQFTNWVENQGIEYREANRMMKVAKELNPNMTTLSHLGSSALYLIATLPEEEREKEHTLKSGETKTVEEMTVRELEEIKRKNRELEQKLEEERSKPAKEKVVEVEKEVVPHDYDGLKSDNQQLSQALREAQRKANELERENEVLSVQYNDLIKKRKQEDEDSKKYKELTEAINEMEGRMTRGQKRIQAQKDVYDLVRAAKELLIEITPIPYVIDTEYVNENEHAKKALLEISKQTNKFLDNLNDALNEPTIIEGEFTNE